MGQDILNYVIVALLETTFTWWESLVHGPCAPLATHTHICTNLERSSRRDIWRPLCSYCCHLCTMQHRSMRARSWHSPREALRSGLGRKQ